jgi:Protein of unknown function (DUF3040)
VLSERDRRALDAIERQVEGEDPRFAASMRRVRPTWTDRWAREGYDAIIVLAAATAALCFAIALLGAGVVAAAVVVGLCRLRPRHFRPRRTNQRQLHW